VALTGTGRARRILCIATFWNKGAYMAYAFTYAGCVVVVYVWGFLRISSQMKNANDKHGSVSYTFKEDGFEYRSSLSHSETAWAAIDRAVETRGSPNAISPTAPFLR
jgi:hypothetical protein